MRLKCLLKFLLYKNTSLVAISFLKKLLCPLTLNSVRVCSVTQLCLALWDPVDCSPPGSSVHGILQARVLERVAISFSRGASQLRDETHVSCVSCTGRWIFYHCVIWKALTLHTMTVTITQSCPTLCNPMAYTVHGILQARILDWVAYPFSRGASQPRNQTQVSQISGRFFTRWSIRESQEY